MRWPYQHTPYLSALPGVGGYGLDVSRGDLPSKLYNVISTDNVKEGGPAPHLGPNCFEGTLWWCWYADQGANFHKYILPLRGGYAYLGRGMATPDGRGNFDYIGHAAPGAGLVMQTAAMLVRGSNSRIWHMPSWVGDLPSADGPDKFRADQRDALQGSSNTVETSNIAHINCEAVFSMDEAVQFWYATRGISWIRGAIFNPLHSPPDFVMPPGSHHEEGVDHGYGQLLGGRSDFALSTQSLYAHTTGRNPLVAAANYSHINNLHYNHGRPYIGRGEGLTIDDNGDHNAEAGRTMQCNAVGNVTVRGPEQGDSMVMAVVQDVTDGSTGHSEWNSQFGWDAPSSQAEFFKDAPADYLREIPRRAAWPVHLGFDYRGVRPPARDPLKPTKREGLDFVQLMRENVGCMPARRYLYAGGVNKVLDQIDAAIRGPTPTTPQYINTVAEAGGWPNMPTLGIAADAANPEWWHAPFPIEERDEIVTEGVLLDGSSAVGYSRAREWIINQDIFTRGR